MENNSVIPGVFCDIQGTLLDYDAKDINKEILDMLKKYEQEGKRIHLWTGGDTEEFSEKIAGLGMKWSVLNKHSFRNKTVEIAIDDIPEKKLFDDYKIKAQTFVFWDTGVWD